MMRSFNNSRDAVESVYDILQHSSLGSPLTITIVRGKYAGFCVISATVGLSDDTKTQQSFKQRRIISDRGPDYTFPPGGKAKDAGLE